MRRARRRAREAGLADRRVDDALRAEVKAFLREAMPQDLVKKAAQVRLAGDRIDVLSIRT